MIMFGTPATEVITKSFLFLYVFIVRAVYLMAMIQLTMATTTTKVKMAKMKLTTTQLTSWLNLKRAAVHTSCSKLKGNPCSKLKKQMSCLKQTPEMKLMLWHSTQVLHRMQTMFYFSNEPKLSACKP